MTEEEVKIEQQLNEEEAKKAELEQKLSSKNQKLQKLYQYYQDFGNLQTYRQQNEQDKKFIQNQIDDYKKAILEYQYSDVSSEVFSKKIQNAKIILNNLFNASTKLKENRDNILKECHEVDNASKAIKQELDSIVDVTVSDIKKSITENNSIRESLIKAEVKFDFQNYEDKIKTSAKYAKREQLKTNIAIAKAELIVNEAKMKSINLQKEILLGNKAFAQIGSHVDSMKDMFIDKNSLQAFKAQGPQFPQLTKQYFDTLNQIVVISRQMRDQLLKDRKILTDAIEQYANAYKVLTPIYMKTNTSSLNCKLTHDENTIRIQMLDNKTKRYNELIEEGKFKISGLKKETEQFQKRTDELYSTISQQKQDMEEMEKYGVSGAHTDKQYSDEKIQEQMKACQAEKIGACERFVKNVDKLVSDIGSVNDAEVKSLIAQIKECADRIQNSDARKAYEKAELEQISLRCEFAEQQLAVHPAVANPQFVNMYYQSNLELAYDESQRFIVKTGAIGYMLQALLFPQNDDLDFHGAFVLMLKREHQADMNRCVTSLASLGKQIAKKNALPIAPALPEANSVEVTRLLPVFRRYENEPAAVTEQLARFFWVFLHIAPHVFAALDESTKAAVDDFANNWNNNGAEFLTRRRSGKALNEKHPFFPPPFSVPGTVPPGNGNTVATPEAIYSYYARESLKEYKRMTFETFMAQKPEGIFKLRNEFIDNLKKELKDRLTSKSQLKISEIAELCLKGHNYFLYHALKDIADDSSTNSSITHDFNAVRRKPDILEDEEMDLIKRRLDAPIQSPENDFFIPNVYKYKQEVDRINTKSKKNTKFDGFRKIANKLIPAFCAVDCNFDTSVKAIYSNPFASESGKKTGRR